MKLHGGADDHPAGRPLAHIDAVAARDVELESDEISPVSVISLAEDWPAVGAHRRAQLELSAGKVGAGFAIQDLIVRH